MRGSGGHEAPGHPLRFDPGPTDKQQLIQPELFTQTRASRPASVEEWKESSGVLLLITQKLLINRRDAGQRTACPTWAC